MRDYFSAIGFQVKVLDISWNNKVMTDYIDQFCTFYEDNKTTKNYVLGFSFGAMIALLAAPKTNPDKLYLCSLSPYFSEDLDRLKPSWKKAIGTRRLQDFASHHATPIASSITIPTVLLYRAVEAALYPQLQRRCKATYTALHESTLIRIPNAPHAIDHPNYITAIKAVIS